MMQQPTNNRSSKGKWWLVTSPSEGSGRRLAVKAACDKSVDGCTRVCDDKASSNGGQQPNSQPTMGAAKGKQWLVTRQPEGSG